MTRSEAAQFIEDARRQLEATLGEELPPEFVSLLERSFHTLDVQRGRLPLWPCNLDLVPAPAIRAQAGPVSYRHLFYGLAEHFWLIRFGCGYRGDQHLLDVGCGYGKTALALLRTIRPPGSYTGFDINPKLVEFLRKLFVRVGVADFFRAEHFPIDNQFYRHAGASIPPSQFVFPYEANRFHCAVLFSVFTHMGSAAVKNYVNHLARVVIPGGTILVSAFLLENAPEGGAENGAWAASARRRALREPPDPHERGVLRVLNVERPEYLVAYRLDYLVANFREAGCHLVGDPLWGSWSGRPDFYGYQDYLIFRKRSPQAVADA